MNNYKVVDKCLACGNPHLTQVIDLGNQQLANSYVEADEFLESYPLQLNLCQKCFHSQLSVAVDPDALFKKYLYVSGTSQTLRDYFEHFAEGVVKLKATIVKYAKLPIRRSSVLDIASNDGSLLECFKKRGWDVQGVDPAENLKTISESKGIPTEVAYWNQATAEKLGRQFDVIVAMNVLAHTADPLAFLKACVQALKPHGRLFVQTSQCEMFHNGEFDTIYHEHISYFSANSFCTLASRAGLICVSQNITRIHGNSYLMAFEKEQIITLVQPDKSITRQDELNGRHELKLYEDFAAAAKRRVARLNEDIDEARHKGFRIVGFGAAAKGNTVLNFGNIHLDYIVDDNDLKWGLLTPGMNIPIHSPGVLEDDKNKIAFVILAWNFAPEIKGKIAERRNNSDDVFIRW